ncbi:tRNA-specific adenosine deaminase 3 [Pancytospora philotis]|nr:tRNA-specific adenosine deaminase 3 [Pancytospora philotis]
MFRRLPLEEEERAVSTVDAVAIEVVRENASEYFKAYKSSAIPAHLKRVKTVGDKCFFLVRLGACGESAECVPVKVPEFPPCTTGQYSAANAIWPCNYHQICQESIEHLDTTPLVQRLVQMKAAQHSGGSSTCSGICIIADENELLCTATDEGQLFGHAVLRAVSTVSESQRGYLCTGYTAYLYAEPCFSCAMALVHGRIKRVLCYTKRGAARGPFSQHKFNYNKHLNHRFNVYFHEQ